MNKKKLLALLMALVMTFSLVPVTALATEVATDTNVTTISGGGAGPANVPGTNPSIPGVSVSVAQIVRGGEAVGSYETLAAAINAAESGDTIKILNGTWGADAIGTRVDAEWYNTTNGNRFKSLTIEPAEGATVTFTSNVILGYDDSSTTNADITVRNIAFENAVLSIGSYVKVTVEGCTFTGAPDSSAGTLVIRDTCCTTHKTPNDTYPDSSVIVRNCIINGSSSGAPGIRLRNTGDVTLEGNTIENTKHNGILIEENDEANGNVQKNITITNNTIKEWNAGNIKDGGRAIRLVVAAAASGSVTINDNYFIKATTGLDEPDFVKIADKATGVTVDLNHNFWNGMALGEVSGNASMYKVVNDAPAVNSVIAYVAQIIRNEVVVGSYETLDAAVAAANPGDTVKLLDNITYDENRSVTLWEKAVNLDLDGHTLTTNSGVGKDLSNLGHTASAICYAVEKGAVTISNGRIETAYGAGVYAASNSNAFVVTLKDLTIIAGKTGPQTTPEYTSAVRITGGAKVIIESGSYTSSANALAVSNTGGEFVVNGGTFKGDIFFNTHTNNGVTKSITINGGKFNGEFVNTDDGTLTISGGHFTATADPTNYLANGYEKVDSTEQGYKWTVQSSAVAQIGNVKYNTLKDAFDAANTAGTATIEVLRDCTLDSAVTVNAGSDVTLDLNGKSVTVADNVSTRSGNEVTSTADGVKVTSQNACGYTLIQNSGTLKITGTGTIDGSAIASGDEFIYDETTNPSPKTMYLINNDGEITIESGTFKMYPAIKSVVLRSEGTANLKGGSFSAWSAVLNDDGGVMTVDGGTYRGWAYSGNAAGYRYAFAQYGTDSRLTINNGDFKGVHGTLGVSVGHTEVKGGTFETRPITEAMINSGEVPTGVSATPNAFHTVYAAGERGVVDITISGGNFYNAGSNDKYVLYIGNDSTPGDGGIGANASARVTGGTFTHRNNGKVLNGAKNTGSIEITGGTYVGAKFNGTSYVANGYSAYQDGEPVGATYTYKIGVVKDNEVQKNTESSTSEQLVYTGRKTVVESQDTDHVISVLDSITVKVKPSTTDSVNKDAATKAPAALTNVTDTAMTNLVSVAVDKAPNENGEQTIEVTIQVAKSKGTITEDKAVYEVHPEAVIKTGNTVLGTVRLSNDEIKDTFSFKLDVTGAFNAGDSVYVTNTHANGTSDVYGPFTVATVDGKQIVNVTGVKKFSEVVVTPAANGAVSFNGAGLRRRVRTVNNVATDEVVNSSTDIRFSFSWEKPTNATGIYINENDVNGSYFEWRKSGSNQWRKVYIKAAIDDTANLVICEVPKGAFGTNIEVKAHLVFDTTDGKVSVDSGIYTRSISQVATSLAHANPSTVNQKWIDYGNHLLGNRPNGYHLGEYGESANNS